MIGFTAFKKIRQNRSGTTLVEFAMVAPVMILLIMGIGELMYTLYAKSILDGAVQKAARDAAIQGGGNRGVELDEAVMERVHQISANATYRSFRLSYHNFSSIRPERFVDSNGNGIRDAGECFEDINNNGVWDANPGIESQGGASDVTHYKIQVKIPRIFPLATMLGWSPETTLVSQTLLKNQPYNKQSEQVVRTICT